MGRAVPEMTETAMTYFVESALAHTSLYICHQIHPEGDLRTIKGRLFDNALGTVSDISQNDIISLISCITEEISLKNSLCAGQGLK